MKQVIKLNILILGSNIDGTRIADEINHLQLKATNHFIRDEPTFRIRNSPTLTLF